MRIKTTLTIINLLVLLQVGMVGAQENQDQVDYTKENENSFNRRMEWFVNANYGMFIHFGLYSQLGGVWKKDTIKGYGEWIQATAEIVPQEYAMLMHTFNPKDFSADKIVALAKMAGMKYIVITAKHHEGFCLWDSRHTNFDVSNTPFKRDILLELSEACQKNGIKFGLYYSIIDWHHSSQQRNSTGTSWWTTWGHVQIKSGQRAGYIEYMKNQIKELVENYNPDLLWFDGHWVDWWNNDIGVSLYNYVRSLKPSIIMNNRVAKAESFKKDYGTIEQKHLKENVNYKWEACYTLNESWGFKYSDNNWKSSKTVYEKIKEINANGGNLLLNIGPDGMGNIPQKSFEILKEVGGWLQE